VASEPVAVRADIRAAGGPVARRRRL